MKCLASGELILAVIIIIDFPESSRRLGSVERVGRRL